MGSGHGHLHGTPSTIQVRWWPRYGVIGVIVLCGSLALLGVLRWWPHEPSGRHVQGSVPVVAAGVTTVHATLGPVRTACTDPNASPAAGTRSCGDTTARVLDGPHAGTRVAISIAPDVARTGLRQGDRVLLLDLSKTTGSAGAAFEFYRADRGGSLGWLAVLFALVVLLVAWRRGLMALISLVFAAAVVLGFLIPALLAGAPPVPTTLSAAVLILIVMLYATHGISIRTSVALVGALLGLGLSAAFASLGVVGARLAGLGDDSAELLISTVRSLDVQQLVVASVVVAGLGTLNDVTVTQTSALWELREASPATSTRDLFRRAMRIGRDHVASSVYTLVFAYLGTALVLLVAVQLYRGSPIDFITAESVAEEIVRTLVGGIALVLAMPVTTALAALVVTGATTDARHPPPQRSGPRYARSGVAAARRAPVPHPFGSLPSDPWQED